MPEESNKQEQHTGMVPKEGEIKEDQTPLPHPPRKRVRIRVKKRIRIKKKPSSKKKLKKYGERALWTLIIVGFIASLIVMIVELDIRDERYKQKRKANTTKSK
jgi:hypothetical protein